LIDLKSIPRKKEIKQELISTIKILKYTSSARESDSEFDVYKFNGESALNKTYSFKIYFVSETPLEIEYIADKEARFTITDVHTQEEKNICGRIMEISENSVVGNKYKYIATIVSPIQYLETNVVSKIFHKKTAVQIIKEVMKDYSAVLNIHLEIKLDLHKCPIRDYTTQYNQSDLSFINMLAEQEGYTLIHDYSTNEQYTLTICELNEHVKKINKKTTGSYNFIKEFSPSTNSYAYYDEHRPSLTLDNEYGKNISSQIKDNTKTLQLRTDIVKSQQIDKLNAYKNHVFSDLERYSKLNAQRYYAKQALFDCYSKELYICEAIQITLGDEQSYKEAQMIITSAKYEGVFPNALGEYVQEDNDKPQFVAVFQALPYDIDFKPQKIELKPKINGVLTAIVSQGSPNACEHANEIDVDDKGRIRVLFHFAHNVSSCYLRYTTFFAGDGYGAQFIPRVNSEVVVAFINGDPDKPIILKALHNGENKNPYPLPTSHTQSFIKTHSMPQHDSEFGHNEINFEDKKDAEVLRLRAQKDVRLHAQNNAYKKIQNNQQIHIKSNEDITIGANQTEFVKRSKVETIAMVKALSVGGAYQISVGAAKNESIGLSSSEQVGHTKFVVVGKQYVMQTGDSYIEMNSNGNIIIKGNDIQINAQTQISLKGKAVALNSAPSLAPNPPEIPAILPVAAAVAPVIHAFSQKNEVGSRSDSVADNENTDIVVVVEEILGDKILISTYAWEQYNGLAKKMEKVIFITYSASIFGYDIPIEAYGNLYEDLNKQAVKNPDILVSSGTNGKFDTQEKKIIIGDTLIENSIENKEEKSAKLLHILIEEYGEYIEYLLRNEYSDVKGKGESSQDEGAKFAFALPNFKLEKEKDIKYAFYKDESTQEELVYDNNKTYEELISVKDKELLILEDGISKDGRYKYFSAGRGEPGKTDSYGHEKLEDALEKVGFREDAERKEIYFGNWLRDYSQVVESKVLELDLNNIKKSLEDMSDEKTSKETSTNIDKANNVVQKHLTRASLTQIVAVLAKDEFAKELYNRSDTNKEYKEAFNITEELLGVYLPAEHLDNPKGILDTKSDPGFRKAYSENEGAIHPTKWHKNYFDESIAYTKSELQKAVQAGRTPKGRVHFGAALHVLEDVYSHSNYCELLLHKIARENEVVWRKPRLWTESVSINNKEVYPLVSGTFGTIDTMVSFLSILEKVMDEPINCKKEGRSKFLRITLIVLKDYDLELANNFEAKIKLLEDIDGYIPKPIDICSLTKYVKQHINNTIAFLAQKTLSETPFHQELDPYNPTHSQIGKDHDDNPLHVLAAKNATTMLNDIGRHMFDIWDNNINEKELLKRVDLYFTHPDLLDYSNTIPHLETMYKNTKVWANKNPHKIAQAANYKGDIEHAREELERIAKKSQEATNFILDTYLKYGENK